MRRLILVGLLMVSSWAQAQVSFQSFTWRKNDSFELQYVQNGAPFGIEGVLPVNGEAVVTEEGRTLSIKSYEDGSISAIVTNDIEDNGLLFFIELQGDFYIGATPFAIVGSKLTLASHLAGSLEALKNLNGWSTSQSVRAIVQYFRKNPSAQFSSFYDAVELGEITTIEPNVVPGVVQDGVMQQPEGPARPQVLDIEDTPSIEELPPVEETPSITEPLTIEPPLSNPNPEEQLDDDQYSVDMAPNFEDNPRYTEPQVDDLGRVIEEEFEPEQYGLDGNEEPAAEDWMARERERQRRKREGLPPIF